MEKEGFDFLRMIMSEYGLAVLVLVAGNIFQCYLYRMHRQDYRDQVREYEKLYASEKADRKEAWKAHNNLAAENNRILSGIGGTLITIQERIK
jgi:hypothetical protein